MVRQDHSVWLNREALHNLRAGLLPVEIRLFQRIVEKAFQRHMHRILCYVNIYLSRNRSISLVYNDPSPFVPPQKTSVRYRVSVQSLCAILKLSPVQHPACVPCFSLLLCWGFQVPIWRLHVESAWPLAMCWLRPHGYKSYISIYVFILYFYYISWHLGWTRCFSKCPVKFPSFCRFWMGPYPLDRFTGLYCSAPPYVPSQISSIRVG